MEEYMKEQVFILENYKDFEPRHIFDCGQCFRWNIQTDGSYTGVFKNNVLNVKKENNKIIFKGICSDNIIKVINEYFDFDTDYNKIKEELSNVDEYLKESIEFGSGIRILNQDLWETIISFIISANNNIPRIKGIIERISKKYGNELEWNNEKYYTFPTPEQLSKASIEDLRTLGLGFRDKRVYDTTKIILNNELSLKELIEEKNVNILREKLLTLPGVGPKVADCIMLFGLKRFEVFPIDVWVRRVMNDLYIKNEDETKVNKREIEKLAMEKYKNLAGLAQQYLFYWKRETA
ncbi:MAG: 8-oxoguanine DNA glycosylase [Clostridia bacterium]|nr:8-oxoguanine DNA glycosylase [Clostridia bacterium]